MIILDPPKFAQSARQVESASRGYKDINWLAFRLLKPGGVLVTFSCSGAISADLFQKIVFGALADCGPRRADHPLSGAGVRSSGGADLPRRRVSQGADLPRLVAAVSA